MADIRIATDYLQDLFEKLDNRLIDPALADWVFAHEAWQVVQEKLQAQAEEIEQLRRRAEDAEGGEQYVTGLVKEAAEVLGLSPYHNIVHRARAVVEERDRLRGEIERPQPVPQWLLDQCGVRLKPCPFCGADAVQLVSFVASSAELDMRYLVQCEKCLSRGPVTLYSQEAVAGWNYAQEWRESQL